MTYPLSQKELESVSRLSIEARLAHFVKRVADWEEVWSLRNSEGWVLTLATEGQEAAPFWPHPAYATACAQDIWVDCEPQAIDLAAFMEKWLPGLAKEKKVVAVFPAPSSSGALIHPESLLQALVTECRESYGDDL
ncbi:MAG: DUF2750 domain-containing protein [Rhodocyclaceae bacterium]|nr:DUF2750 domain-containing protein [Rhodocyclaceae bacterium]